MSSLIFCLLRIILFTINHLLSHTIKFSRPAIRTKNSIKLKFSVYIQLNDQTVRFQTSQFCTSHYFVLSLNVKQFLGSSIEPYQVYNSGSE